MIRWDMEQHASWIIGSMIWLPDGVTFVVTEKGICRSKSGAEGRADFWRVGADDGQLTVVDLQILL